VYESHKLNAFLHEFDELEKLNQEATKEQADLDRQLSNWYHNVEGSTIKHVSESHKMIKDLKVILDKRRAKKIEVILLRSLCDTLRDKVKGVKANNVNLLKKNTEVIKEIKTRATEHGENNR